MREYQNLLITLLALAFTVASAQSRAGFEDCRNCHELDAPPGAEDYSAMYEEPLHHHPIGVEYPLNRSDFVPPSGRTADVYFFDSNHNGMADENEVQLFDLMPKTAVVECSTCHMAHGDSQPAPGHPQHYLRFENKASSLCTTCHIY